MKTCTIKFITSLYIERQEIKKTRLNGSFCVKYRIFLRDDDALTNFMPRRRGSKGHARDDARPEVVPFNSDDRPDFAYEQATTTCHRGCRGRESSPPLCDVSHPHNEISPPSHGRIPLFTPTLLAPTNCSDFSARFSILVSPLIFF